MSFVEFRHVAKTFDNGFVAVKDFSLTIAEGELMVLVGPSGCGKSTLLRILAGLDQPTSGEVLIDGVVVNDVPPRERDIAMVFQSYALYPHLSVRENIEFGLKLRHVPEEEIERRVASATQLLGLTEVLDRKPKQLSGGQRQRVAMGRALVREPKVFLMDEPLSNLDAKLRVHMRSEIGLLQQRLRATMLYVTHDQVEAMTMGDRVAVMRDGEVLQVGTPKQVYNEPLNAFVAAFVGSPAMNLAEATIIPESDDDIFTRHPGLRAMTETGGTVTIGIRPEHLEDARLSAPEPGSTLKAKIDIVEELGSQTMVHFGVDAKPVQAEERSDLASGSSHHANFVGAFDPRTTVANGDSIDIAVDTTSMHFFNPQTGASL
jgi:multiple sugar transport system ATP-binding protein